MGLDQPAWVQYWRYISGVAARRSRPERVDRPPGAGGFQAAPAGDARAHFGQPADRTGARHPARRPVGRPSRHRDRPCRPHRRRGRRRHADLLDRAAGALCLLLPAGCRAAAAGTPRRRDRAAAGDHRPLRRRQPAHRQLDGAAARRCISSCCPPSRSASASWRRSPAWCARRCSKSSSPTTSRPPGRPAFRRGA